MKLTRALPPARGQSAFTMVEISICLAIIIFGLVAVIGVLPLGMNVQKDNREETVIGQDAQFFLDAIRHGDHGVDDLTNYVVAITNYQYLFTISGGKSNLLLPVKIYGYTTSNSTLNGIPASGTDQLLLTNGAWIIGLLSTPRFTVAPSPPGSFYSNYVFGDFHSLNGPAGEKYPQQDKNIQGISFGYRLTPEILSMATLETNPAVMLAWQTNMHELRLQFRWPLLPYGVGNNRLSFRTMLMAGVSTEYYIPATGMTNPSAFYFFNPNNVSFVPPQ